MEKMPTAKGKIQEICDLLKTETIEPAKLEAKEIVEKAHTDAALIIKNAEEQIKDLHEKEKKSIEDEQNAFDSSLHFSVKQTVQTLKQQIEKELFNSALFEMLEKPLSDPEIASKLINSIVSAIEKEGIDGDLSAEVASSIAPEKVNENLLENVKKRLSDKGVQVDGFKGGVMVQIKDKKITIDMSDEAVKDLVASFVRKEFREMVFSS